jgi:hypothetical protein
VDWVQVLDELYARRSAAFATASSASLRTVYASGSADLARTTEQVEQLRRAGAVAADVRLDVVSARVLPEPAPAGGVVLDVVDVLGAWTVTGAAGEPLLQRPGRGEQRARVELAPADGGWVIAATRPAP